MSRTNDPKNFFQTSAALDDAQRKATKSKNAKGNPLKLPSKLLAVAADSQNSAEVYVAEAAGTIKRINLETNEVAATYSGPTAPLTSVAISSDTVYAGSWDKTIWSWDVKTRKASRRFQGHSDFVKTVLVCTIAGKEILISGSADASIIVWDATAGDKLHTLKGHTRGILALAVDPLEYDSKQDSITIFSAGSDREIRRWNIGIEKAAEIQGSEAGGIPSPIIAHETSIDSLYFDVDGDLWTASAEKSVKCLARSQNFTQDTKLEHPDFVRDVVVDEEGAWVVTACRDEEVRVFEKGSGKLKHTFEGHFEEVTGLVLVPGQKVVSVAIDGTVRQWSLKPADLAQAIKEAEEEKSGMEKEEEEEEMPNLLTEEEEAELAELMENSD